MQSQKSVQSLCEERSDEAICFYFSMLPVSRLLRFARNDGICECIKFGLERVMVLT